MNYVLINKDGYLASPDHLDCTIKIEINNDEQYKKLCRGEWGKEWRYLNGEFIQETVNTKLAIQNRRKIECFDIIDNRSQMWYNRLTAQQKQELDTWYEAWLNAPETKIIPEKPEWLK